MGPEYESSQGKINQEQEQQFQEVASVAFGEVRRGSQINVYCVLEERTRQCFQEGPDFEITVTGPGRKVLYKFFATEFIST